MQHAMVCVSGLSSRSRVGVALRLHREQYGGASAPGREGWGEGKRDGTPGEETPSDRGVCRRGRAGRRAAAREQPLPESVTPRGQVKPLGPGGDHSNDRTQPAQPVTRPLTDGLEAKGRPIPGIKTWYVSLCRPMQVWRLVKKKKKKSQDTQNSK